MLFAHDATSLMEPYLQYGAFGLCALLIGVLSWGGKRSFDLFERIGRIIERNTNTIDKINDSIDRHETAANERHEAAQSAIYSMRDKLMTRPCIAKIEQPITETN